MKHAENNLRGKHVLVAILTGAIMIAGTFTTSFAQAGNRLYLRFDDNATTNARGIRIKPSEGNDYYWVFGDVNPITGNGVAKVQPGCIRINHRHYSSNAALTAITNVSDFVTNGTDITVAAHRWSRQFSSPPAFLDQAMPLTRLDQNINLITGNSDDYPLNTRFMHPGAKIVRNGGDYITAFNCYDLTGDTTAGGGNLMDWGMAKINATTMAVTWSFAFAHINPNNTAMRYHEDVRDVLSVAGNAYVACGAKRNFGTMQFGGIVAKVDNNGALLWYREYYAPGGARIYFTCISEVLIPNGTEYIVSGSYSLNNQPGTRDGIITAGLDPATGAVIWCYVWTPPVPYTAVVPSGGMQSGFRHVNMPDRGIVVCAIVQNQNTQIKYGSLFKIWHPTSFPFRQCDGDSGQPIFSWGGRYATRHTDKDLDVDMELVDVTRRLNAQNTENDVAAVGTALVQHSSTFIQDVAVLETEWSNMLGYGRSYSLAGGVSGHCQDAPILYECSSPTLDAPELTPERADNLNTAMTELRIDDDTYYRICDDNNNDPNERDLTDGTLARRVADEPVLPGGTVEQEALRVAPLPASGAATISFRIPAAGNATLALYDMHGKEVLHIASQAFRVGTYSVTASLDAIPSGMYMLRLTGEGYARSVLVPVIR